MKTHAVANRWMPLFGWMLLIFVGSTDVLSAEQTSRFVGPFLLWLDPQESVATITTIHFALRKLGHLAEYAILATLLWCALRGTLIAFRSFVIAGFVLSASMVFAASDEFHQAFVPSRTASPNDVMIDICGAAIALALCVALRRRSQRLRRWAYLKSEQCKF
jgi:VanZ family protein